ncbi:MAG: PP2C family protein-serine/threonine phosphatase [Phycisphaerales bacterium]
MTPHPTSITEFLTDGSLAGLCDAAGRLLGADVVLRDGEGRLITASGGRAGGDGPLRVAVVETLAPARFHAPISAGGQEIGSLALAPPGLDGEDEAHAERLLQMVAAIVGEVCELSLSLSARIEELDVIHRLTRLLAGDRDIDEILQEGLRLASSLLDADAGTIRVLEEGATVLRLRAHLGLSQRYLAAAASLPAQEAVARAALDGEAVAIEDLGADERILRGDAVREEGLRSMLSAGLVFHGEPMGVLRLYTHTARRFTRAEQAIVSSIGRQIATAVATARLLEAEVEAKSVRRQLEMAAAVQRRMLPNAMPKMSPFDIGAEYESSLDLSGDFYDVFRLGRRLAFVVGDVAGKGIPAAMLMSSVRASLRAFARNERESGDVAEILARTNRALCRDSLPNELATIFLGLLDPESLELTYCSAGHEPTLLLRPGADDIAPRIETLDAGGLIAGVLKDAEYTAGRISLQPGDTIIASTDGLSEAMNFEQRPFGRQCVRYSALDILNGEPDASARRIATHLLWEMRRYTGLSAKSDDATIVVVRVGERPGE